MRAADVIVVGLGAVGAAAIFQLARRGARVLGIDRFDPPHDQGSSHGETRITRQGVGEGDAYAPLALRSHEIWRELEAETGDSLLLACGLLILGAEGAQPLHHGKADFIGRSVNAAKRYNVPHEQLDAKEIAARYPQFQLIGEEVGYFEPGGGLVYPERCIAAQLRSARRRGARIQTNERVLSVEASGKGVRVTTDRAHYEADQVVVAAGAWTPGLIGAPLHQLALQPQALHWFEANDPAVYAPERFPTFIWMHGARDEDLFYGFPIPPGAPTRAVKVATKSFFAVETPEDSTPVATAELASEMYERHVRGRLRGVGRRTLRSAACIYTRTPDADFILDRHPGHPQMLIASACSGHGFKHSAAVGELLAQIALDGDCAPLEFRLDRLGRLAR